LARELEKRNIKIVTGARVEEIKEGMGTKIVKYSKGNSYSHIEAECVLAAVGRATNLEGIYVEKLGIEVDSKMNIKVNNMMETTAKGIYAVGDVTGGFQLAHSAYAQAEAAAENCMGGKLEVNLETMPRCICSIPQLASAGLTEDNAREKGIEIEKSMFPYAANGKALAADEPCGFVKVICEKNSGKLLGVHILGSHATELVSSAAIAINMGASAEGFQHMIFPHPTMSDLIKESVLSVKNMAIHISKSQRTEK